MGTFIGCSLASTIPQPNPPWSGEPLGPGTSWVPYRIYNIGNNDPVELKDFIASLENKLGKNPKLNLLPVQPGDVPGTFADVADLERDIGFKPKTSLREGIGRFVDWYLEYYGPKEPVGLRRGTHNRLVENAKHVTAGT